MSPPDEVVIVKKTTGASRPWNLSTVPTLDAAQPRRTIKSPTQESHLVVVGSDHHEVLGPQRRSFAALIDPRRSEHRGHLGYHNVRFLGRFRRAIRMKSLEPAKASAELRALLGTRLVAGEATFIDLIGDESADVGVHATRFGDEDALVLGQRRLLAQDVFEHARARAIGMLGLGHLTQLQRVTEQDQIFAPFADATASASAS